MSIKGKGKLTVLLVATATLIATIVNDKKNKEKNAV